MPFNVCPKPDLEKLAISSPRTSMAALVLFDVNAEHEAFWNEMLNKRAVGPHRAAGAMLRLFELAVGDIFQKGEELKGRARERADVADIDQSAAQMLSALAVSTLLRLPEIGVERFGWSESDPDLVFDVGNRDQICLYVKEDHLPIEHGFRPAARDLWYDVAGVLAVHQERPPVPSAVALEHEKLPEGFFDNFVALTPHLLKPPAPSEEDLINFNLRHPE